VQLTTTFLSMFKITLIYNPADKSVIPVVLVQLRNDTQPSAILLVCTLVFVSISMA